MTEKQIQGKILQHLRKAGIYHIKIISATKGGAPDIVCCIDGRFVAFEVKSPKGKPTELQLWNHRLIQQSGGEVYVIHSFEEYKTIMFQKFGVQNVQRSIRNQARHSKSANST